MILSVCHKFLTMKLNKNKYKKNDILFCISCYYRIINVRKTGRLDVIAVGLENGYKNFYSNEGPTFNDVSPEIFEFVCHVEPEYS